MELVAYIQNNEIPYRVCMGLLTAVAGVITYFIQRRADKRDKKLVLTVVVCSVFLQLLPIILDKCFPPYYGDTKQDNTPAPTIVAAAQVTSSPTFTNEPKSTNIPISLRVGDTYSFGRYEQSSATRDGAEPIEWIVLATNDDGALLISRYVLDCVPYNNTRTSITWETCSLRTWMNENFYYTAFSGSEREGILLTTLDNDPNPDYGTRGCGQTKDYVFALSFKEACKYLTDAIRNAKPTTYARANGAQVRKITSDYIYWWLRTPGETSEYAMITSISRNDIDTVGNPVGATFSGGNKNNTGVRPSLWLSWDYIRNNPS